MSLFRLPELRRIASSVGHMRDRLVGRRPTSGATDRSFRRLIIDPLEQRQLLSVSPVGPIDHLVNETFTGDLGNDYEAWDQDTLAGQSLAVDDDGDFVVTWTRYDYVIDPGTGDYVVDPITGGIMLDANVYARYYTDEVQRITLPEELGENNVTGAYGRFSVTVGGNEVQKLTITSSPEPYNFEGSYSLISGTFSVGFDVNDNGSIGAGETFTMVYDELTIEANEEMMQAGLRGLGGALTDVVVDSISPHEFYIYFGDQSHGEDVPEIYIDPAFTHWDSGFLPAALISTVREPVTIEDIPISPDDPEATARVMEQMFLYTMEDYHQSPTEFLWTPEGPYPWPDTVRYADFRVTVTPVVDPETGQYSLTEFDVTFIDESGKANVPEMVVVKADDDLGTSYLSSSQLDVITIKEPSPEFRVNDPEPDDPFTPWPDKTNQTEAAVVMDADGDFVIIWSSEVAGVVSDTSLSDIYARRFKPTGYVDDPEFVLVDGTKVHSVEPLGNAFKVNTWSNGTQDEAAIGMDPDGNFTIAWVSTAQDISYFNHVSAQEYNRDGERIGGEFIVLGPDLEFSPGDPVDTSIHYDPYVALSDDGHLLITWCETDDPNHLPGSDFGASWINARLYSEDMSKTIGWWVTGDYNFNEPGDPDSDYDVVITAGWNPTADFDSGNNFTITYEQRDDLDHVRVPNLIQSLGIFGKTYRVNETATRIEIPSLPRNQIRPQQQGVSNPPDKFRVNSSDMLNPQSETHWSADQIEPQAMMDADGDMTVVYEGFGTEVCDTTSIDGYYFADLINDQKNADLLPFFDPAIDGLYLVPVEYGYSDMSGDVDTQIEWYLFHAQLNGATDEQLGRLSGLLNTVANMIRGESNGIFYSSYDADTDWSEVQHLASDSIVNSQRDGENARYLIYLDQRSRSGNFQVALTYGMTGWTYSQGGNEAEINIAPVYRNNVFIADQTAERIEDGIQDRLDGVYNRRAGSSDSQWTEPVPGVGTVEVRLVHDPDNTAMEYEWPSRGNTYWSWDPGQLFYGFPFATDYYVVYEVSFSGNAHDMIIDMGLGSWWQSGDMTLGGNTPAATPQIFGFNYGTDGEIQTLPSSAMEPDGDYVVAWSQWDEYTSGKYGMAYNTLKYGFYSVAATNIYFRVFDESTDTAGPDVTDFLLPDGTRLYDGDQIEEELRHIVVTFDEELTIEGVHSVLDTRNWALLYEGVEILDGITDVYFGMNMAANFADKLGLDPIGSNKWEAVLVLDANGVEDGTPALRDGHYEIVAKNSLRDVAGNALGRTGYVINGETVSRDFYITIPEPEIRVNTQVVGDQENLDAAALDPDTFPNSPQSIAGDADADHVVVWVDEGLSPGVYARLYNVLWSETPTGDRQQSTVAMTEILVTDDPSAMYASVARDEDGDFVVTWSAQDTSGDWDVYAKRYDATGNIVVVDESQYVDEIQLITLPDGTDGSFVLSFKGLPTVDIAWSGDSGDINTTAAAIQAGLDSLGLETEVTPSSGTDIEIVFTGADGERNQPQIEILTASADDISAQVLIKTQREGRHGEFRVNAKKEGIQRFSTVAMDVDGDFVVTWQSQGQDGSGYGVYAQRYSRSGELLGGLDEIQVIEFIGDPDLVAFTLTFEGATTGAITYRGDLGIVADRVEEEFALLGVEVDAWVLNHTEVAIRFVGEDGRTDQVPILLEINAISGDAGADATIYTAVEGQISEFLVNDTTDGDQLFPSIAMDSSGSFVISWTSYGQDGDAAYESNVYAKQFASSDVVYGSQNSAVGSQYTTTTTGEGVGVPRILISEGDPDDLIVATGTGFDGVVMVYAGFGMGSGSLLTTGYHVLTAAHVVSDYFGNALPASSISVAFVLPGGQVTIPASEVYVHSAYNGNILEGHDVAVIVLAETAPDGADRYDIYRNSDEVGQVFDQYGYGATGTGAAGEDPSYPTGILRGGSNRYDASDQLFPDLSSGVLVYDFDDGTAATDAFGQNFGIVDTGLGDEETNSGHGDSGGPCFISGLIAGITSGGFVPIEMTVNTDVTEGVDSSFGEFSIDARISYFATWIDAAARGTPEFRVNQTVASDQKWSAVAMDADGDFVITWTSYNQDGGGNGPGAGYSGENGVFARRYHDSGAAAGDEFQVNTFTQDNQQHSRVAMDADGDFMIVWESFQERPTSGSGPDSPDSYGIYAQRYVRTELIGADPAYGPNGELGGELHVNGTESGAQRFPAVTLSDTGDAVVVWSGDGVGGKHDIFARRYYKPEDDTGPIVTDVHNVDLVTTGMGTTATLEFVVDGSILDCDVQQFVVTFGEDLDVEFGTRGPQSVTNPDHWEISRVLLDGSSEVLTDGVVDIEFGLNKAFELNLADQPSNKYEAVITFDRDSELAGEQPLDDGQYILTIREAITDLFDNPLDGNYDGTPGSDYRLAFTVLTAASEARVNAEEADDQVFLDDSKPIEDTPNSPQSVATDADGDYAVVWTDEGRVTDEIQKITFDPAKKGLFALSYDTLKTDDISYQGDGAATAAAIQAALSAFNLQVEVVAVDNEEIDIYFIGTDANENHPQIVIERSATGDISGDIILATSQNGDPGGTNEKQTLTIPDGLTGAFKLRHDGHDTVDIDHDGDAGATAAAIQAALDGLGLETTVAVYNNATFTISFKGADGGTDQPQIEAKNTDAANDDDIGADAKLETDTEGGVIIDAGVFVKLYDVAWMEEDDGQRVSVVNQMEPIDPETGLPWPNNEILVTANPTATYASIAMDADGDFVVTWSQNDGTDVVPDWNVYAQRYNAAGTPTSVVNEVQVITLSDTILGSFTLAFNGLQTGDVVWDGDVDAAAAAIQAELDALGLQALVTPCGGSEIAVHFVATYGAEDQPEIAVEPSSTGDISANTNVVTTQNGESPSDEIQLITLGAGSLGTFGLSYDGQTTGDIPYDGDAQATALAVQGELIALGLETEVVALSNTQIEVRFVGADAQEDHPQMVVEAGTINDISATTDVTTSQPGQNVSSELQRLTFGGDSGNFVLNYNGHATADIAYDGDANATAAAIQVQLDTLGLETEVVALSTTEITIHFVGTDGKIDHPQIVATAGSGTDISGTITIDVLQQGGLVLVEEIQEITLTAGSVGNFALGYDGSSTADIAYNGDAAATAATIQTELATLGLDTQVEALDNTTIRVRFVGTDSGTDHPQMIIQAGSVDDISGDAGIATVQDGQQTALPDEIQRLVLADGARGVFVLNYAGEVTDDIAFYGDADATAATAATAAMVQDELDALGLETDVVVLNDTEIEIRFHLADSNMDHPQIAIQRGGPVPDISADTSTVVTQEGGFATLDEIQTLTLTPASHGNFRLEYGSSLTNNIAYTGNVGATATAIQNELGALGLQTEVTTLGNTDIEIHFVGADGGQNMSTILVQPGSGTDISATVHIAVSQEGGLRLFDEMQRLTLAEDLWGIFALSYNGVTTGAISHYGSSDVTAKMVQTWLDAMGLETVVLALSDTEIEIQFIGADGGLDHPLIGVVRAGSGDISAGTGTAVLQEGGPATVDEVQTLTIANGTPGTFVLSHGGLDTGNIFYGGDAEATATVIQTELAALSLETEVEALSSTEIQIRFVGGDGLQDKDQIIVKPGSVNDISADVSVVTSQEGGNVLLDEIQELAVTGGQSGPFALKFNGQVTHDIGYYGDIASTAAQVQTELDTLGLATSVTALGGTTIGIRFVGADGGQDQPLILVEHSLTGDLSADTSVDTWRDGKGPDPAFRVNTQAHGVQRFSTVAMDHDGDFIITWQTDGQDGNGYEVYAQRYDRFGKPLGVLDEMQVLTFNGDPVGTFALSVEGVVTSDIHYDGDAEVTAAEVQAELNLLGLQTEVEARGSTDIEIRFVGADGGKNQPPILIDHTNITGGPRVEIAITTSQNGQAGEFRVNQATEGDQLFPSVAMDARGNFVVTWTSHGQDGDADDETNVYARQFTWIDNTKTEDDYKSGSEFLVNQDIAGNQRWSDVAMDQQGDFVITWTTVTLDPEGNPEEIGTDGNQDVMARRYEFQIDPADDTPIDDVPVADGFQVNTYARGTQQHSSVAIDADGDFTIVWESFQDWPNPPSGLMDVPDSFGIFAQRYVSNAKYVDPNVVSGPNGEMGDEFAVNGTKNRHQRFPGVALDDTGDVVIVWSGNGDMEGQEDEQGIFMRRYDQEEDDAGPTVTDVLNVKQPEGEPPLLEVVLYDGVISSEVSRFVVLFSEDLSVAYGELGAHSAINPEHWELVRNGDVVPGAITSITFGLNQAYLTGLKASQSTKYGAVITFDLDINEPGLQPLDNGEYVLTLRDDIQDIFGNPLDGNLDGLPGDDLEFEFSVLVGDEHDIPIDPQPGATVSNGRTFPETSDAVAVDADGDHVVAWTAYDSAQKTDRVFVRVFDAEGSGVSSAIPVTSEPQFDGDMQRYASVAVDADSDFVVTWTNYRDADGLSGNGREEVDVYARRYQANGTPAGEAFRVNTYVVNDQKWSAVAMDVDGDFVIAWSSYGQEDNNQLGFGYGVYARRYDSFGYAYGPEFQVNTTIAGNQQFPSVAMDAFGAFVVVWQSDQNGIGDDIVGRVYNADGSPAVSPLTGEFMINDTIEGNQRYPDIAMNLEGDTYAVTWSSSQHTDDEDQDGYAVYTKTFNRLDATEQNIRYMYDGDPVDFGEGETIRVPIDVDQGFIISDLDVRLTISHDDPSDLFVWLEAPNGLRLRLFSQVPREGDEDGTTSGANGADFDGTLLNDEADVSITAWEDGALPPFDDEYQPEAQAGLPGLAIFDGMNAVGTWTLVIQDNDPQNDPDIYVDGNGNRLHDPDGGRLRTWSLEFTRDPAASNETLVNTTHTGNQMYSSVAMNHHGEFVVVWCGYGDQEDEEDQSQYGIFSQRFNAAAEKYRGETRLNIVTDGMQWLPSVGMDGEGNYVAVWTGDDPNTGTTSIYGYVSVTRKVWGDEDGPIVTDVLLEDASRLLSGGVVPAGVDMLVIAFGEDLSVAEDIVDGKRTPAAESVLNLNNWILERNGTEIVGGISNVDFGWNSIARRYEAVLTLDGNGLSTGSEGLSTGNYVITISDLVEDLFLNQLDGDYDGEEGTEPGPTGYSGYRFEFSVSETDDTFGAEKRVNQSTEHVQELSQPIGTGYARETSNTSVAVDGDGDYVVVWTSYGQDDPTDPNGAGVYAQLFDRNNNRIGTEFRVNNLTAGDQQNASVAMDVDGDFIVVWDSESDDGTLDVYSQRFTASGERIPNQREHRLLDDPYRHVNGFEHIEVLVNTTRPGEQFNPSVAVDSFGNYVVAWGSAGVGFGYYSNVYVQVFDYLGRPVSDEVQVNQPDTIGFDYGGWTAGFKVNPAVAMDPDGDFVVTWDEVVEVQSGVAVNSVVMMRMFDRDGTPKVDWVGSTDARQASMVAFGGTDVARMARNPSVDMDAEGNFVIAYEIYMIDFADGPLNYDIYYSRFWADGFPLELQAGPVNTITFTDPFNPDSIDHFFGDDQVNPSVAMAADDQFAIVFNGNGAEPDSLDPENITVVGNIDDAGVFGQWYFAADEFFPPDVASPQRRVNVTTGGVQQFATIAMEPDGDAIVVWCGNGVGDQHGVFARRYNEPSDTAGPTATELQWESDPGVYEFIADGDNVLGNPLTLLVVFDEEMNTSMTGPGASPGLHSVENVNNWVLVNGRGEELSGAIHDVSFYADPSLNKWVAAVTFNGAGGNPDALVNGNYTLIVSSEVQDVAGNALALTGYRPNGTGRRYDDFGNELPSDLDDGFGFQFTVNNTFPGDPSPNDMDQLVSEVSTTLGADQLGQVIYQDDSDVAKNAGGDYVVVWVEYREVVFTGIEIDGEDVPIIPLEPALEGDIMAQRFDARGREQGEPILVNSLTVGEQIDPAVAIDDAGNFVVVWSGDGEEIGDSSGVFAQRFDADGVTQGGQFRVNQYTNSIQDEPAVAMNPNNGDFVVTWTSFGQDGSRDGIFARRYHATGQAYGDEFQVNTRTVAAQGTPDIAMNTAGNFVITWASEEQDASGSGVYAQRFNAAGTKQGGEFRVNSYQSGDQLDPAVGMDRQGNFVITWASQQDGSGMGVYAQRYNAAGTRQGGEFRINQTTIHDQFQPDIAMTSVEIGQQKVGFGFVITWTSFNQDTIPYDEDLRDWGVFARMYNSDGTNFIHPGVGGDPVGEFRVNAQTVGNQYAPAVSMDAGGHYVVTWSGLNTLFPTFETIQVDGEDVIIQVDVPLVAIYSRYIDPPRAESAADSTPVDVFIPGTSGDDVFEFIGGPTPGTWVVKLNGAIQSMASDVAELRFTGGGGHDTVIFTGSSVDDAAELWSNHGTFSSTDYTVIVEDVDSITASGGGGDDLAILHDSSGDDTFVGQADASHLSGNGFLLRAEAFENVQALAEAGGTDVAELYDTSGDDIFTSVPSSAEMVGDGYTVRADDFEYVKGFALEGGSDVANLYDSPEDDRLVAMPGYAKLYNNHGLYSLATGFDFVRAYATAGGDNSADMYGSDGNDTFTAGPTYAKFQGDGFYNRADYFESVIANGQNGTDTAYLYDSTGNDTFVAGPNYGLMFGDGFENRANFFRWVYGYGNTGGTDLASLYDSSGDDYLFVTQNYAQLYGDAYFNRAYGFDRVDARATKGGYDEATLRDSALNDYLEAEEDWVRLSNEELGIAYWAAGFDYASARSTEGNDTKNVAPEIDFVLALEGPWTDE